MKTALALIGLLMLAPSAQALDMKNSKGVDCGTIAIMAEAIMGARQRGVSRSEANTLVRAVDEPTARNLAQEVVAQAWKEPVAASASEKRSKATAFGAVYGMVCMGL